MIRSTFMKSTPSTNKVIYAFLSFFSYFFIIFVFSAFGEISSQQLKSVSSTLKQKSSKIHQVSMIHWVWADMLCYERGCVFRDSHSRRSLHVAFLRKTRKPVCGGWIDFSNNEKNAYIFLRAKYICSRYDGNLEQPSVRNHEKLNRFIYFKKLRKLSLLLLEENRWHTHCIVYNVHCNQIRWARCVRIVGQKRRPLRAHTNWHETEIAMTTYWMDLIHFLFSVHRIKYAFIAMSCMHSYSSLW